jgi:hypothetical protein
VTLRTFLQFSSDLPPEQIESETDFIQLGGKNDAQALREIMARLGCDLEPLQYAGDHGWDFHFAYKGRPLWCQLTPIERYLVIFKDLHGSKAVDHPDFVEILLGLARELAADPRFHDIGWYYPEDAFEKYEGSPCPYEGLGERPGVDLARGEWSDLSPHPVRRWVARLFDFYSSSARRSPERSFSGPGSLRSRRGTMHLPS